MKRFCVVFFISFIGFVWIFPGIGASETIAKIPRRVFFGFVSEKTKTEAEKNRLFLLLPNFLYTRVSSLRAIVRVKNKRDANSLILVRIERMGGKKLVKISVDLVDNERIVLSRQRRFDVDRINVESFTDFVNETSKAIAPYMREIKPKIKIVSSMREKKIKRVVSKIEYADKLAKKFEFTLWASGLTRLSQITPYTFTSNEPIDRFSYTFPLVFDVGWFYQKNNGLLFSFFFDRNSDMSFGMIYRLWYNGDGSIDGIDEIGVSRSENSIYLGGIGYSYRSLDVISAEFNVLQYFGGVEIRAIDPIAVYRWDDNTNTGKKGLTIAAGETGWVFYSILSLQSILCVNPFPWLSIKVKVALNVNPSLLLNPELRSHYYSLDFNSIFFNFFQMGVALKI